MKDISKPKEAIAAAQALTKKHGTSYYLATKLFPKDTQDAVYALYGFVRMADEIVDAEGSNAVSAAKRLEDFRTEWHKALHEGTHREPILKAAAWLFSAYDIPPTLMETFLDAMLTDTETTRYETYEDLKEYMYGSAGVIGVMLTHIIGAKSEEAYAYAEDLGYAMQLTNFLRDVREDYELRGRIYLPQEDQKSFKVTEDMIARKIVTPEFKALIRYEIDWARELYMRADTGITLLSPRGRKAVRLASVLYSKILDQIEEANYDVFPTRIRTTTFQKVRALLSTFIFS